MYLPILLAFCLSFVQLSLDLQQSSWPQCLSCLTDLGGRQIPKRGEEPREEEREERGRRRRGRERKRREREEREREGEREGERERRGERVRDIIILLRLRKKILERAQQKLNCG